MLQLKTFILMLALFTTCSAKAAAIWKAGPNTYPAIRISGVIEAGDFEKFKRVLMDAAPVVRRAPVVQIDSAGGDAMEAMRIGRLIRKLLLDVDVLGNILILNDREWPDDFKPGDRQSLDSYHYRLIEPGHDLKDDDFRRCYSACVLVFYSGVGRTIRDNHDNRFRTGHPEDGAPMIGLHRPYFASDQYGDLSPVEAKKSYAVLEEATRQYLNEMGAPQEVVDRMFRTPSNKIDLVGKDDFKKYFSDKAPFFEEWLISRCGKSGPEGVLDGAELQLFNYVNKFKRQAAENVAIKAKDKSKISESINEVFEKAMPEGISVALYDELKQKVQSHSGRVGLCKTITRSTHLSLWYFENEG